MGRASGELDQEPRQAQVKHTPHLLLDGPWTARSLGISDLQQHHLFKVLRMSSGGQVTYTDGRGTFGRGELAVDSVRRGAEEEVPRPSDLTVVAAPPSDRFRQRFLVEKLAELGTKRLMWLHTRHGKDRVASLDRLTSWVTAATEQSRGSWTMEVGTNLVVWDDLDPGWVVCQAGGERAIPDTDTVVIGPEGGFGDEEIPFGARLWDLGPNILRIETAAVAAVSKLMR